MKTKVKFTVFDVCDYLDNEVVIAEYVALAEKEGNPKMLEKAKADVAKARLLNKAKNC